MSFEYFGNNSLLTLSSGSFGDINVNQTLINNGSVFTAVSSGIQISASGNFTVEVTYGVTARGRNNNDVNSGWALYRNDVYIPGTLTEMYHDFSENNGKHAVSRTAIFNARGGDIIKLKGGPGDTGEVEIIPNGATLTFRTL